MTVLVGSFDPLSQVLKETTIAMFILFHSQQETMKVMWMKLIEMPKKFL